MCLKNNNFIEWLKINQDPIHKFMKNIKDNSSIIT